MHVKHALLVCLTLISWHSPDVRAQELGLTRRDAIRIALESNPEIVAAQNESEAAKARAVQAGAFPDPELELKFEELPGATDLGAFGERNLGATQTIEFPLRWWFRRRAAQDEARAIRLSVLEATRQDIALRAKTAYDLVLFNQRRLEYNRENLELIQSFMKKAQLRTEAGDLPPLDVMRAEVEFGRATNRLTQVQGDLSGARAQLNTLLGRDTQTPFSLADGLDYVPYSGELRDLKDVALEGRPEVRSADWQLSSARSRQGVARTGFLPDVSIGVSRQTLTAAAGGEDFWRVAFGLELPLWGAARQRAELAEARSLAGRASAERNRIRLQVALDVESAFLALTNTQEQVQLFQETITMTAERAFEVASRSYQEGKATYLDLLEAQRALIEVREEYAN
jgi:cobalt-zinc-cadmium efflux system outer membrane protein